MKLTTVENMQSEIFVPITPKPVFTELKRSLSECKIAFITAGGIHKKDQVPFNTSGDFSYRTIEFSTPSNLLMVTHGGFDNSDINKDVNAMFPIGSNAGEPNNIPMQTAIVKESLEWVRDCPFYNEMKVLPYEYRHNV